MKELVVDLSYRPETPLPIINSTALKFNTTPVKQTWKALFNNPVLEKLTIRSDNPFNDAVNRLIRYCLCHGVTVIFEDTYTNDVVFMPPLFELDRLNTKSKRRFQSVQMDLQVNASFTTTKTPNPKLRLRAESRNDTPLTRFNTLKREHSRLLRLANEKREAAERFLEYRNAPFDIDPKWIRQTQTEIINCLKTAYKHVHPDQEEQVYNLLITTQVLPVNAPDFITRLYKLYYSLYDLPLTTVPELMLSYGMQILGYLQFNILPDFSWIDTTFDR